MILRKINAVLSLLTTILFLDHAIFFSVWMLSRGSINKSADFLPWILVWLMGIHAALSILFAFLGHKGADKKKCNSYPKMNIATIVQRATGILLILLIAFHIIGAKTHFQPKILHAIIHPLFFGISLVHVAISTDKAFITLGIGNAKFIKIVGIATKILCGLVLVASVIGFYLCLFMGVV